MVKLQETTIEPTDNDVPIPFSEFMETVAQTTTVPLKEFNNLLSRHGVKQYDEVWYVRSDQSFWKRLEIPLSLLRFKEKRCSAQFRTFNTVVDTANTIVKNTSSKSLCAPFAHIKCIMKLEGFSIKFVSLNTRRAVSLLLAGSEVRDPYLTVLIPYGLKVYNIPSYDKIWVYTAKQDPTQQRYKAKIVTTGRGEAVGGGIFGGSDDRGFSVDWSTQLNSVEKYPDESDDIIKYGHFKEMLRSPASVEDKLWIMSVCGGITYTKDGAASIEEGSVATMDLAKDFARRSYIVLDGSGAVLDKKIRHRAYHKEHAFYLDCVDVYLQQSDGLVKLKKSSSEKGDVRCDEISLFFTDEEVIGIGMRMSTRVLIERIMSQLEDLDRMEIRHQAVLSIGEGQWKHIVNRIIDGKAIYKANGLDNITTDMLRLYDYSSNFDISGIIAPVANIIKPLIKLDGSESTTRTAHFRLLDKRVKELMRIPNLAGNWTLFFTTLVNSTLSFDSNDLDLFMHLAQYIEGLTVPYTSAATIDFNNIVSRIESFLYKCLKMAMAVRVDPGLNTYAKKLAEAILLNEVVKLTIRRFLYEDCARGQHVSMDGLSMYMLNFQLESTVY